jgi:hypothetical protein
MPRVILTFFDAYVDTQLNASWNRKLFCAWSVQPEQMIGVIFREKSHDEVEDALSHRDNQKSIAPHCIIE